MNSETPELPTWGDEPAKAMELARMKFRATMLLVGVTIVFFAAELSEYNAVWVGFVLATAEAAMVGAVADWFAVTALFRHPMGIKIPHTAIIPSKKNSFGERLGGFVQQNFLTGDIIVAKLASIQLTRRTAEWLTDTENSRTVANLIRAGFHGMFQVVKDEDVRKMIEQGLLKRVRETQAAPIIGSLLDAATSGPKQRELLIGLVNLLIHFVDQNKRAIQNKIIDETPWWMPWSLDEKVYTRVMDWLVTLDRELADEGRHPIQEKFDKTIKEFVERLKYDPDVIAKGERIKEDLLNHPTLKDFSDTLWAEIKSSLLTHTEQSRPGVDGPIEKGVVKMGQVLLRDEKMMKKIDSWLEEMTRYLMQSYGHEIGSLISHTVERWDPDATSRKIELQVGKDLQYIRINGTVVGGLVGLLIHTVSHFLP